MLQQISRTAIDLAPIDFAIIHGWRDEHQQTLLFDSGASRLRWPLSAHNALRNGEPCSLAVDFAPWINGDIPWSDSWAFSVIAGVFFAAAEIHGTRIRWGGDWNMDGLTTDQTLLDYGHIELLAEDWPDTA